MTNPAEKIRQVVEGHIEALDGIELYKGGKRTSMCLVSTAKESTLYMAESILNAIIEEMNNYLEYHEYHLKESLRSQLHSGAKEALRRQIKTLKEARTSITTTL